MIPQISPEELEAAGLTTGWIVMILLVLGSLVAGFLTQAVKVAVVGSYERGGKPEPAWCHALWTLLPFGLGSLVVAGGSLVVGLHVFWGISLGLVAGGSSSGAVRWYKRLTNRAGLAAERHLDKPAITSPEPASDASEGVSDASKTKHDL